MGMFSEKQKEIITPPKFIKSLAGSQENNIQKEEGRWLALGRPGQASWVRQKEPCS